MILHRIVLISSLVLFVHFDQTYGQDDDCVPDRVQLINIASNATLWWEVDLNESCEITSFEVDIAGSNEDEYHFDVIKNFVDLSFLEVCEKWNFTVTPISNGVPGAARTLTAFIPLPPDADLSISSFRFTLSGRNILLEWDLRNQTLGDCSLEYRLTLQDLDLGTIEDVHVEGRSARLEAMSPCISYQLSIRAINQAHPTTEGPLTRINLLLPRRPQVNPILKSVDIQVSSINMTWTLEGSSNRCPLRNFYIDGGLYFNESVSLQDLSDPAEVSIEIKALRPNSMYYFRAYVENSGGRSAPTPIAVQTLELS